MRGGFIVSCLLGVAVTLPAQEGKSDNPAPAVSEIDLAWAQLQSAALPVPDSELYAGKTGAELTAARTALAAGYIDKAERLQQFYTDHPDPRFSAGG